MNKLEVITQTQKKVYEIPTNVKTLMHAFEYIEEVIDPTFEYDLGCRSGVCGSCTVRVDAKEVLACQTPLKQSQSVEPLLYSVVVEGLRVKRNYDKLISSRIISFSEEKVTQTDVQKIEVQSDCILCNACYSACPVLEVNSEFLGPFALTRVLRYADDRKEKDVKSHIDAVQKNGVWDCTLCAECALVCPQGINSKLDIMQLRNKSVQHGYNDPNFQTMSFGF